MERCAVLAPHQDSVSSIRVRPDVELYLHEAPAADAQALQHSLKFHRVLNMLENSTMKGERVLRLGIGNLDMQHPTEVEVEGLPLPTPKGQADNRLSPELSDIVSSSRRTALCIITRRTLSQILSQLALRY